MIYKKLLIAVLFMFIIDIYNSTASQIKLPTEQIEMGIYDLSVRNVSKKNNDVIHEIKDMQNVMNDELNNKNTYTSLINLAPEKPISFRGAKEANIYKNASRKVVLVISNDGIGSGTLINNRGEILTNWHVVRDQKQVGIIFKPITEGGKISEADIKRANVIRFDEVTDLALVKVVSVPKGIEPIILGDEKEVIVGADVHAIGHPTGENWTYTKGVISQFRRDYEWSSLPTRMEHKANVIQIQTPINPGNSGGPLLTDDGKIIGVNSFKKEGEGLNFAISIDEITQFLSNTKNRYSKTVQKTKQTTINTCEPKEIYSGPHKKTQNMYVIAIDLDCDGKVEGEVYVPNDKSEPIVMRIDSNKDGYPDIIIFDMGRDKKWDYSLHDVDFDRKWDMVGYHPDGDITPSSYEPYETFMAKSK